GGRPPARAGNPSAPAGAKYRNPCGAIWMELNWKSTSRSMSEHVAEHKNYDSLEPIPRPRSIGLAGVAPHPPAQPQIPLRQPPPNPQMAGLAPGVFPCPDRPGLRGDL